MDPQAFTDYIAEPIFILVPALFILSVILRATPRIADWLIPYILVGLGVVGSVSILVDESVPVRIAQGVLVAGVTILGNKAAKEGAKSIVRKNGDDEK